MVSILYLLDIDNDYILYRYFLKMLEIFLSPPLYTDFIIPPKISNLIPDYVLNNMKLFLFIGDLLGAIVGSHFNAFTGSD